MRSYSEEVEYQEQQARLGAVTSSSGGAGGSDAGRPNAYAENGEPEFGETTEKRATRFV